MSSSRYNRETMSAESRAEVDLMREIDGLLGELERDNVNEERRGEIASEVRQALGRYKRLFGRDEDAKDLLRSYEQRLEKDLTEVT